MDFHLTRGLRLKTEPEYKNLYKWAINELDPEGKPEGGDQIPWAWTLYFTATACALGDTVAIKTKFEPERREATFEQAIRVTLRPGASWRDKNPLLRTRYSMFGTDRYIEDFRLDIYPITDPKEEERCEAWGCVSYTTEIDFRNETIPDCVVFYLYVKPETFARYAAKVAHGLVDEIVLSVKSVSGFYSEWSPGISTSSIKVLTAGDDQRVVLPDGVQFEVPRIGYVGDVSLYINRNLEFAKPAAPAVEESTRDAGTMRVIPETREAAPNPQILQMLASLKQAAWWIVGLLTAILITMLLKR